MVPSCSPGLELSFDIYNAFCMKYAETLFMRNTPEHILESFKLSESVSTFILSWKLSLLDLICSQLSENALRAKSCVFCHFWSFETLAFFTFCWFWPSRSHWRPFLDLESTKALWLSYPNLFLHLIYLYPFPCKSSEKIDSFFMAEQSK